VDYFHVVFTIPKEIHPIVRSNPAELLDALIKAAAHSLIKIMADPKYGGGQPGLLCILHTWTRTMDYHPHVHCLVPAVVITNTNTNTNTNTTNSNSNSITKYSANNANNANTTNHLEWRLIEKKFLVPVKALADIFRAKFIKMARKKLLNHPKHPNQQFQFPQSIWKKRWVVFCKASIKSRKPGQKVIHVLRYLARYVHRIAITNNRILSDHNGKVTFKYQKCNHRKWKKLTLDAMEFIRRFLQHVLPNKFHKIRYYGFLSPSRRDILKLLKEDLESSSRNNTLSPLSQEHISPKASNLKKQLVQNYFTKCPICKIGNMLVIEHFFFKKNISLASRPPP